jgi:outer membrane protein assembly factor BamB
MLRTTITLALFLCAVPLAAEDWPHWRGPLATGVSTETGLPVRWDAKTNVAWSAALAGQGVSTPIVVGERVIVTSQVGAGVRRPGNHPRLVQGADAAAAGERALVTVEGGKTFFVVEAFAHADGKRLWAQRFEAEGDLTPVHDKHNLATPSPVSDGTLVYAWFGTGQIVALGLDGTLAWRRHLGREISPFDVQWGHASSPVVHGDLLYLLCDHAPASYLLAVDKRTGRDRWKADRGKGLSSYSTPFVVSPASGPAELIVNSSERVDAYDAATGKPLWHVGGANRFPIPMPVVHDGIIYLTRGYRSGPYLAMRPGGRGDVNTSHVVWSVETGAPYVSSLVFANGLLFMANDTGIISAVDAKTGERVWQHRVPGVFSASPLAADGRVYFVSESGRTIVMRAARTPEVLAENDLGARLVASPAASRGRLFLRSDDRVFAIGQSAVK